MNDEIREILDEYITDNDWIVIATNVLKYLKDYITNLQNENQILKDNNENMQEEMNRTWERTSNLIYNIHYDELHHYRVMRDIEEILKNKDEGFIETYDKLEKYIKKEIEKYE